MMIVFTSIRKINAFKVLGRAFGASTFAAVSQILGLLQFYFLLRGQAPDAASDAYFLMYAAGMLPTQVVLLGILYPLWLRSISLTNRFIFLVKILVALASSLLVLATATYIVAFGNSYSAIWPQASIIGVNAALSSLGWARAIEYAASGQVMWLSSATLLQSLLACISLAIYTDNVTVNVTILATSYAIGSLAFLALIELRAVRGRVEDRAPGTGLSREARANAGWFGLKSLSGYGSGVIMQSVAATLPASSVSIVSICQKLVGGFSTIVTNTVLPRFVHRNSGGHSASVGYSWIVTAASFLFGILLILVPTGPVPNNYVAIGILICGWISASATSSSVQRVAMRSHNASYSVLSIGPAVLVSAFMIILGSLGLASTPIVLAGLVGVDLLTGVAYCCLLKEVKLASALLLCSTVLILFGLNRVGVFT